MLLEGGEENEFELKSNSKSKTLNEDVVNRKGAYFLALFLVGIFNNNGYVLVQAGSHSLADTFK